jgi:hypothetical protein
LLDLAIDEEMNLVSLFPEKDPFPTGTLDTLCYGFLALFVLLEKI